MSKRSKSYTKEFRQEAVKLALSSSSISGTARDLGIPEGTLYTWIHKARQSGNQIIASLEGAVNVNVAELLEEHKKLKKRLARLEEEKAILKKAATYFAKELG